MGFGGQKLHQDPLVLQVQHWLEAHFAEKFRFEDLAREHGMSIRNFMRRFQAATGDKPLHYLQRLRIETAKGLLSASQKSIKTISYDVGYDDASFFARLFRQHTGASPNEYRQRYRADSTSPTREWA
jgi:transcriptional regulator GlxA family with amidase domain